MSAFLGPIHFWLYNKIQFQENLIDELVAYVTAKGWSDKADQYVSTDRRKLDEVIDEANIHGWLQSRIHDAEGRYAALVLDAAGDDGEKFDQVNRVRESDDARIAWDRTMDLHSEFWQGHGDRYYALRQALVDGLLSATDYALESPAEGQYEIVKKSA